MSRKAMIGHHVSDAAKGLRHVFVRDLSVMATLGIHEHEKLKAQRIIVNIDLSVLECTDPVADTIDSVVSYEIVVRKVEAMVAEGHVNLVETLAEKIAAACLKDRRVVAARVRIEKPDIIANARSVGIEIERVKSRRR